MRRLTSAVGKWWLAFLVLWLQGTSLSFAKETQIGDLAQDFPVVTNIAQLDNIVRGNMGSICAFSITGTVLSVNAGSGVILLQDDSGTGILQTSLAGFQLKPGQRIHLQGTNYVALTDIGVSLGKSPLVDNDGRHSNSERHSMIYLKAGLYPIQVLWFNYSGAYFLGVDYSGPGIARQPIPDSVLFRPEKSSDENWDYVSGLNYRCFEGEWQRLPDFQTLSVVKRGIVSNFDVNVEARADDVGLEFNGFLLIKTSGLYTFYLPSDDGSQLFIHNTPIQLTVTGDGPAPAPVRVTVRQPLPAGGGPIWAETEGQVTLLGKPQYDRAELELTSEGLHMRVVIEDALEQLPRYLLGSQVLIHGICPDTSDIEGHRQVDTLVVPNWKNVQVLDVKPDFWSVAKMMKIGDCQRMSGQHAFDMVCIRGKLRPGMDGQLPDLVDDTGSIPVELLNAFPTQSVGEVECLGIRSQNGSTSLLRKVVWRELSSGIENNNETNNLPILTSAAQVQELSREEAQRGYQAKLEGVVTWVAEDQGWIVLNDSTRGVSVVGLDVHSWIGDAPRVGEKLEIQGTCFPAYFAPIVALNKVKRLGMDRLPAPMHPTWQQLIGGSVDAQYIELSGLVTASQDENHMTLLMPDGKMEIEFYPTPASPLTNFINSVVTIRGVAFANWNIATHMVTPDRPLRFGSATISMDTLPPSDPFDAEKIRAREMMQFDVRRNTFQRVKVSGQFLCDRDGTCYMTDDGFGWRLEPVHQADFKPGDTVEAVGLVELGGPSPILREAIARTTGHLPLPSAQPLVLGETNATDDSSLVWLKGVLLSDKRNGLERELGLQTGLRNFVARLPAGNESAVTWPIGSLLKLTGVISDLGSSPPERQNVNSFELLLSSPADVELVARPPWWTLNRLLTAVALLATGLALTFIWVSLLRRQVERRTIQLKREISERQKAEQERAIEQERSRIARDLHDDLGSRVTAINMLAVTSLGNKPVADGSLERLQMIADKSRRLVTTLDGLVWAVNPQNDTVAALAEYLASFAEEFLAKTGIICSIELPHEFPHQIIASEIRHNTLLAASEALNNAVRHAHPGEVRLQLTLSPRELAICIRDNGCGFDPAKMTSGNGLSNIHERMHRVNGHCRIESVPGNGTSICLMIPLEQPSVTSFHSQ